MLRHSRSTEEAPFSEPLIVTDCTVTGCAIDVDRGLVRFTWWTLTRTGSYDEAERRIILRTTMSVEAARDLWKDLGAALRVEGAHHPGAYQLEVASAQFRDAAMDN
jgi:hypothetical protein